MTNIEEICKIILYTSH